MTEKWREMMGSGKEWREITEKWREKLKDGVDLVYRWTVLVCMCVPGG